ncbi:hypothetical protein LTS18_000205, partial [Coniosporium uncinatum]
MKEQPSTTPSSATAGFFQTPPEVENQFFGDVALRRAFTLHLPAIAQAAVNHDLSRFGSLVLSPQVIHWIADAEANPPYLRKSSTWGYPDTQLITSEGWRQLQELGIREGIIAIAYEGNGRRHTSAIESQHARLYQFLKYHLWTGSCANVTCPSAMTDGAARLLASHIARDGLSEAERAIYTDVYSRLTSRDPARAWTSGQWMTERSGGSDVQGTETLATYTGQSTANAVGTDAAGHPLGPWSLSGFKWFSSATDSDMAILLAKTPSQVSTSSPSGTISLFFAPTRRTTTVSKPSADIKTLRHDIELNGIHIHRLKQKLGTKPLPTAELVLNSTRAYLLGQPGQGTKEISTILNITRVHTAVSALGYWGRGLAISRAFARVRRVAGGAMLSDVWAHVRTMAIGELGYRALMQLGFFVVRLLGMTEHPPASSSSSTGGAKHTTLDPDPATAAALFRLLTPLAKALCAKAATEGLAECMESLGGVGYLENEPLFNVARLYRDCSVLSIWEGTTDVLAADIVRVLKPSRGKSQDVGTVDGRGESVAVRDVLGRWMEGDEVGGEKMRGAVRDKKASAGPAFAGVLELVDRWVEGAMDAWGSGSEHTKQCRAGVSKRWKAVCEMIQSSSPEELKYNGRNLQRELGFVFCAILLVEDAKRDNDDVAWEVARRYILRDLKITEGWKSEAVWDK